MRACWSLSQDAMLTHQPLSASNAIWRVTRGAGAMLWTTSGPPAFSVSTYTSSIVTQSATAHASAVGRSRRTRMRSTPIPPPR